MVSVKRNGGHDLIEYWQEYWKDTSAVFEKAQERFRTDALDFNIVPRKFYPRGVPFEPDPTMPRHSIREIALRSFKHRRPKNGDKKSDEAYSLHISKDGKIQIDFENIKGGQLALQTLSQLFYRHSTNKDLTYTPLAPVRISDNPIFEHRGLNLDISRNQIFPEDVIRTIDGMAMCKLNRLHLHAADSQSWPLDIPALPKLAAKGAYEGAQIWTAERLQEVQEYGRERAIEVYLEIDLPGHVTAISMAFPDLVVAANHDDWPRYALEPPAGQLKLNSSDVYTFLDTLFADLLPRVSLFSKLFHFGGDEVNCASYLLEPDVNSSSHAALKPLVQNLMTYLHQVADTHAMKPVLWEEMVLDWNLTLPSTTLIQTWRSKTSLADVVARGRRALFGPNPFWYLDCGLGGFLDPDPANPDSPSKSPYGDYCSPYKNWRHVLSYDPLEGIPEAQRHLVEGGEAHLWAELTDSVTLDGMLWPRLAAAAEVMWRGGGRTVDEDATRSLAELRERLVARGIRAGMVQMEWCLRNRGKCKL